jgi:hypothetical protein
LSVATLTSPTLSKLWFSGHREVSATEQVTAGAWQSFTVTLKLQPEVLPAASVAVQATVVVPTGKNEPDAGEQLVVTPGQLSAAVGAKVTTAPHWSGSLHCVMGAGQVIVGASVSCTVTVNEQLGPEVVPQVTVVVPTGKEPPEAGVQVTVPQLPAVVGEKVTIAAHWPGSFGTVMLAGQVIVQQVTRAVYMSNLDNAPLGLSPVLLELSAQIG